MKQLFLVVLLAIVFGMAPALAADKAKAEACGDCNGCAQTCSTTLDQFLKKGGKYADPKRVSLLRDCIAICKTNDGLRKRKSEFFPQVDKVCGEVCAKCAQSCEELNDPSLKGCIELCKKCSTACKAGT